MASRKAVPGAGHENHAAGSSGELFERGETRALLTDFVDDAERGNGALVVVEGPAGIGKTRLIRETKAGAIARGLAVAAAVGGPLEHDFSYGAVRQLFEPLIRSVDDADRLFAGGAAAAGTLFARRPGSAAGNDDAPGAVQQGLYWLTVAVTDMAGPLVMICDDAHWFDAPSLRYMAYLAERVTELPVTVIIGTRPPALGAEGDVLRRLLAHPEAVRVTLKPLSPIAVSEIVRSVLGSAPEPSFTDVVARATGGNPFLIGELLRAARAAGLEPTAESAGRLSTVNTETSMFDRIARLPPHAIAVARSVAVLGVDAHIRHVATMTGLDIRDVGTAADVLFHADILGPERPLAFVHPLVEHALYSGLLPGDRSTRHRAAASALAAEQVDSDRIARHLMVVEPAGDPSVVDTLARAARSAMGQGATDVAISQLRRALAEPAPPERRLDLVLRLGAAESFVLDPGAIEHLSEAIREIPDPDVRVLLATARAVALALDDRPADAVTSLLEVEREVGNDTDRYLSFVAAFAFVGTIGGTAARLVEDRIAELISMVSAESEASPAVLGVRSYFGAWLGEDADDVALLATRALSLVNDDDPMLPAWFHLPVCALVMVDRDDEAIGVIDRRLNAARRRGAPALIGIVLFLRSLIALRAGDLDDAESDARAVLDLSIVHDFGHLKPGALAVLVVVHRERDDLGGAEALLTDHGFDTGDGDGIFHLFLLHARARLHGARGRWRESFADLERGLSLSEEMGIRSPGFVAWRANMAFAMFLSGRIAEAQVLAQAALVEADKYGVRRARAEALRVLAMTGATDWSEVATEAISEFAKLGARLEEARTLLAVARSAQVVGTPDEVRLVSEALALAERCGAIRMASMASSTLRSLGVRGRKRPLSGLGALTASERRVASLAAAGRTNREVAQELFVTTKTVESHLAHAFQKLGITSRAELRRALAH